MKKLIALIAFALCIQSGIVSAQKIAHVDIQKVMLALPERKVAEDSLKKEAGKLEAEMKRMQGKYEQLIAEYDRDKKAGALNGDLEQVRVQEIQEYQQRMMKFENYVDEVLAKKQEDLINPMIDKVKAAVSKVAKANGINYVFDIVQFAVIEGGTDITPLVMKELGLTAPTTPQP